MGGVTIVMLYHQSGDLDYEESWKKKEDEEERQ